MALSGWCGTREAVRRYPSTFGRKAGHLRPSLLAGTRQAPRRLTQTQATSPTSIVANDAMASATVKLQQAESAESRARKTAQDWGLNENAEPLGDKADPDPVAEAPREKKH